LSQKDFSGKQIGSNRFTEKSVIFVVQRRIGQRSEATGALRTAGSHLSAASTSMISILYVDLPLPAAFPDKGNQVGVESEKHDALFMFLSEPFNQTLFS
jgi:hypothetical protein